MKSKRPKRKIVKRKRKAHNYKFAVRKHTPTFFAFLKGLILVSILAVVTHVLFFSGYFNIKNIEISGAHKFVNSEDVNQVVSSSALNKNILLFKRTELSTNLKDNFLGTKDIKVRINLPETLIVEIKERVPIAIVYKEELEQFLVDQDGYVLGYTSAENDNLPRINYEEDISVGLFINKNLVPVYTELTALLLEEDIKVSSISFHPKHVTFSLSDGENVLVSLNKSIFEAVKALSALLKQAAVENKVIQRVDLRYDKVIVLFN